MSVRLELRITPEQHAAVQQAAEKRGVTVSSVVRELIDERVEDDQPFPGAVVRAVKPWGGDDDA
jgi:predicted DNA-binding protein